MRTKKLNLDTPFHIEDLLHEGQEVLVQVSKEPLGTKGARITSHISLPGRHLVLMPMVDHVGVSRRIENEAERQRLREIIQRIKPAGCGFIVRTASEGKGEAELAPGHGFSPEDVEQHPEAQSHEPSSLPAAQRSGHQPTGHPGPFHPGRGAGGHRFRGGIPGKFWNSATPSCPS